MSKAADAVAEPEGVQVIDGESRRVADKPSTRHRVPLCVVCEREFAGPGLQCPSCRRGELVISKNASKSEPSPRMPFPGRIELTLPWTALAPDNENKGVIGTENRERHAAFKAAKLKAAEAFAAAYDGEPFAGPVRVTLTFWFPDNRPRDPLNFGKALLDAMKGIIVTDDKWQVVRTSTFDAAGIDRDRPRCECVIEVSP
jgi:Holliday junction resolvase RusA-like endonuclease